MTVPAQVERAAPRPRRLVGVRRAFRPIADARGMTRWMLWLGLGITLAFILVALFAPFSRRTSSTVPHAGRGRFRQLEARPGTT